ncbi:hypothetical protein RIF29_24827 [Crotalaria pallida]|uniref:Uncharacterized protein n=1 Tax=Crotalaria pallida TaxID=3830 RepID=A0AAN9I3M0_CROPI
MCDESSSVLVGNPADTDFVNEVDHPENAEDEYRIDGMENMAFDVTSMTLFLLGTVINFFYHFMLEPYLRQILNIICRVCCSIDARIVMGGSSIYVAGMRQPKKMCILALVMFLL